MSKGKCNVCLRADAHILRQYPRQKQNKKFVKGGYVFPYIKAIN